MLLWENLTFPSPAEETGTMWPPNPESTSGQPGVLSWPAGGLLQAGQRLVASAARLRSEQSQSLCLGGLDHGSDLEVGTGAEHACGWGLRPLPSLTPTQGAGNRKDKRTGEGGREYADREDTSERAAVRSWWWGGVSPPLTARVPNSSPTRLLCPLPLVSDVCEVACAALQQNP